MILNKKIIFLMIISFLYPAYITSFNQQKKVNYTQLLDGPLQENLVQPHNPLNLEIQNDKQIAEQITNPELAQPIENPLEENQKSSKKCKMSYCLCAVGSCSTVCVLFSVIIGVSVYMQYF